MRADFTVDDVPRDLDLELYGPEKPS